MPTVFPNHYCYKATLQNYPFEYTLHEILCVIYRRRSNFLLKLHEPSFTGDEWTLKCLFWISKQKFEKCLKHTGSQRCESFSELYWGTGDEALSRFLTERWQSIQLHRMTKKISLHWPVLGGWNLLSSCFIDGFNNKHSCWENKAESNNSSLLSVAWCCHFSLCH